VPAPRVRAVVLLLALAVSLSWSTDTGLAQIPLASPAAADLTVLSLNLAMRDDVEGIVDGIRGIGGDAADILVFQEVVKKGDGADVAQKVADALGGGFTAVYRPGFTEGPGRVVGLGIVSRFPIVDARVLPLKRFGLMFHSRERTALAATVETPAGPLRTYNVHLDTRINVGDRVDQIGDVIRDLNASSGRAIIAGDFTTNDQFWLFHAIPLPFLGRQQNGVERYMSQHGLISAFPGGSTHDALRMRLDWMFLKGLRPTRRAIHPMTISDHHALLASLN
jgi:endonuclease/exonuclease/phosphatase family metal-dependent hydrolase